MTVKVSIETNPYRNGSLKYFLMKWALEKGEFTKEEFLAIVPEITQEREFKSKMTPEVQSKAWWNEFYNKHETFVDLQ